MQIAFREFTPDIYYKESRDFQLLGRLFELVLASEKPSIDQIYSLPFSDNSDDKLLSLLALTLGFNLKNNRYTTRQLRALCSVFSEILHNKGNIHAIEVAVNALFNAEGLTETLQYEITSEHELRLYIPGYFEDISILNDILNYILPAGMSCSVIRSPIVDRFSTTELAAEDIIKLRRINNTVNMLPRITSNIPAYALEAEQDSILAGKPYVVTAEDTLTGNGFKENMNIVKPGFGTTTTLYKPNNEPKNSP